MTDDTKGGPDDELVIVEVDDSGTPLGDEPKDDEPKGDEQDGDDSRLAGHEDDDDEDGHDEDGRELSAREKRLKRREKQREARKRTENELAHLRSYNQQLEARLARLEGATTSTQLHTLDTEIARLENDARMAEQIEAKAIEANNGEDAVTARRIREQSLAEAHRLRLQKGQVQTPQADPRVQTLAQQWQAANPWYDPRAADPDSATAKAVDAQMAREGYNPATREYWVELTRRCAEAFGERQHTEKASEPRRKTPPPQGSTRENVTPATRRNEIRVTPERKQAMIDAGVWDDPEQRQRYLKAYKAFDDQNAAR